MSYLPAIAVYLLMIATGMSLNFAQFVATWRGLTPRMWAQLLTVTFLVPPALVLTLQRVLPIDLPSMGGLFLIAVAPGAPLMTRNAAKYGFEVERAASYQVWGAMLAPVMIPLLVAGAARLYERDVWISPLQVLAVVTRQQFVPLLAGLGLMRFAPGFCTRARRPLNIAGNLVLTIAIIAVLWKVGPALAEVGPWLAVAVLTLAVSCLGIARLLLPAIPTIAISNVNRHVGLALLLSTAHFRNAQHVLPAIAAYAIVAPLVMASYAVWRRRSGRVAPA